MNRKAVPSRSHGRGSRVVTETDRERVETRSKSRRVIVVLPAPEGEDRTRRKPRRWMVGGEAGGSLIRGSAPARGTARSPPSARARYGSDRYRRILNTVCWLRGSAPDKENR